MEANTTVENLRLRTALMALALFLFCNTPVEAFSTPTTSVGLVGKQRILSSKQDLTKDSTSALWYKSGSSGSTGGRMILPIPTKVSSKQHYIQLQSCSNCNIVQADHCVKYFEYHATKNNHQASKQKWY